MVRTHTKPLGRKDRGKADVFDFEAGKGGLMANEFVESFFSSLMVLVITLFVFSLPMAYVVGKKKYGWALLYLPVWALVASFAAQNIF